MSVLTSLASAAGLTRPKKKFHFDVTFGLQNLVNCTYVTGVLFAKLRLKDGGSYSMLSRRCDIQNHCVQWDQVMEFHCKMYASHTTGELDPCICKVSIRKETKGGLSDKKLGYVNINLAEYAGSHEKQRKYLLESYNESRHKPDNSILKIKISLKQTSGDSVFKVPRTPVLEFNQTEDEGIQPDLHISRHSSILSHNRTSTASSLSGGGVDIMGGGLSLQDSKTRISSGMEPEFKSSNAESLREGKGNESDPEDEVCSKHSSDNVTAETQSTATPHSPSSENEAGDSQRMTPDNLSPSIKTTRSNSLGSGDHKQRPTLEVLPDDAGAHSLPNRSQAHRRHTSFSTGSSSPKKFHKRQQSLLSGQSSKSTSAYSTLSERSMGSWDSQDIESLSGSTKKLALIPTSSKVEQSRVNAMSVIDKLFEDQTFDPKESKGEKSSKGLQLFVDKTSGTVTLGGSGHRQHSHLQAVDVSEASTIAHSRSSSTSTSGSPRPRHKRGSSNVSVQNTSPKDSVSSLVTSGKPVK